MAILNRFKKVLGIEGLKIHLILPDTLDKDTSVVKGQIELETLSKVTVQKIELNLKEKYERGRKKNKLIDEMVIGHLTLKGPIKLDQNEVKTIDFELPFEFVQSPMDTLEDQNLFYKGLIKLAKMAKGVKSIYKLDATAKVKGTVLDAVDSKVIVFN